MTKRLFVLATAAALIAAPALSQTTSPSMTSPGTPSSGAPSTTAPGVPQTTTPGQGMGSGMAPGSTATGTTGSLGSMWYTTPVAPGQWRASDLIGENVYNRANEVVGEINELVLDRDGKVAAAIIGVGGFLGIGERNVAVNFSSMQMMTDSNNATRVVLDIDRNRLRDAPEFRRPSSWTNR